jgi:hypothetical protein
MSIYEFKPINLAEITTYDLASRPSKVTVKDFAVPVSADDSLKTFFVPCCLCRNNKGV